MAETFTKSDSPATASVSHVVDKARFKLLPVSSKVSIKDFVEASGIEYSPGKGFYQLTKNDSIQTDQEIVAVRKSDGLQVTGVEVRHLLKIDSSAEKIEHVDLPDFDVFVQSDCYSRVLLPDTRFLYEVAPEAKSVCEFIRFLYEVAPEAKSAFKPAVRKELSTALHTETRNSEAPTYLAGSTIDLVFSFDTTSSMYSALDEVRKNLRSMITRILSEVPNIRIAVLAHGDYCDKDRCYVTKHVDFTTDLDKLVAFVSDVERTSGGDWEECYEFVMHEARTKLSWIPDSQRAMVMIGDAAPHSVKDYKLNYYCKQEKMLDWRKEADELLAMGCRVYSVQCGAANHKEADQFWAGLAYKTYGHHLELKNWDNILHFITAIAFCESGHDHLEAYKQELIKSNPGGGNLNEELHALFDSLLAGETATEDVKKSVDHKPAAEIIEPVKPSPDRKRKMSDSRIPAIAKKVKTTPKKPSIRKLAWKTTPKSPSPKTVATSPSTAKFRVPMKTIAALKALIMKTLTKRGPVTRAQTRKALTRFLARRSSLRKSPTTRSTARTTRVTRAQAKLMLPF